MWPGTFAAGCSAATGVGLDLLLADLLGDLVLLDDRLLVETHALLRHRALLDDGLLGVQRDLVLLLGDRGTVHRRADVRVGDRLALETDLLAPDGDRRLHVLGHDVLAQPRAPALDLRRADAELLLRARHGVVGVRPRRVVADRRTAVHRLRRRVLLLVV